MYGMRMRRSCAGATGRPGRHEYRSWAVVTRSTRATNGGGVDGTATMWGMSLAAVLAAACITLPAPAASTQLVTVQAAPGTTTATVRLWERHAGCWQRVAGPWRAHLGRSGLSAVKREGDGATPTGTFRL